MFGSPEYIEYLRQARDELWDFRKWLVRVGAYRDERADLMVALVCRAIWDGGETADPVEALENPDISRPTFSTLKHTLTRYYVWQLSLLSSTEPEKRYARKQLNRIQRLAAPGGILTKTLKRTVPEMPDEVFLDLVKKLKPWHKKNGPRWPWAWAVLGIKYKLGADPTEMTYLSREDLVLARADTKRYGTIKLWKRLRKKSKLKTVPIGLIWTEAERLIKWPWDWGIIGDLVCPTATQEKRPATFSKLLSRVSTTYVRETLGDIWVEDASRLALQLKRASQRWLFKQLKYDWIALGQVTGENVRALRDRTDLLELVK